jgi:hypothetical protein
MGARALGNAAVQFSRQRKAGRLVHTGADCNMGFAQLRGLRRSPARAVAPDCQHARLVIGLLIG